MATVGTAASSGTPEAGHTGSTRAARGMRRISRRTLGRLGVAAGIGAAGLGGLAVESHRETSTTRLVHLDLTSPRITGRPFRFLQVTDIHDMPRAAQRQWIVDTARREAPDLVVVTGDLVSSGTEDLSRVDDFMARLEALRIPLFFVPGNHEHANAHFDEVMAMVRRHARVELNRSIPLDGPWGKLDVVSTDDYYSGLGHLPIALVSARPGSFRLVLTHSPLVVPDLAQADVDLAVCGHTHGGQVRLPGVGALFTPGGGFLPKYDKGLFQVGRARLYIDSGAGQSGGPRLDDPSQITLVTIAAS